MATRRNILLSLPALAILGEAFVSSGQTPSQAAGTELDHSTVFSIGKLPIKQTAPGTSQHVASGKLTTGEQVEIHNTTLKPGEMPHPPHRHAYSEFMMIREGSLAWMLGEQTILAGPGDILYARSGELHGLKNVGSSVAKYAVLAIGSDAS
jgi:mannose-6-phosphate isomerase-like protein (cupin superfamily)